MNSEAIKIVDDKNDTFGLVKNFIESRGQEEAFYLLDVGDVIKKHKTWLNKMPRVEPHFAMKCNPDPTVIKTLAALNASFDCASKNEIEQVLSNGVPSERIIFANTVKPHSHIKFAKKVGVKLLTVDSEFELSKIESIYPEAEIVVRFCCDSPVAQTSLSSKCGCDSVTEAPKVLRKAKELGLEVCGFSFHVGSPCDDATAFAKGITISLDLMDYAKSLGFNNAKLIDIGGGFPGGKDHSIDKIADAINKVLEGVDPSIRVISEPGRYYVESAFTLASLVYGKKRIDEGNGVRYMYYVNDGTYGSFTEAMLNVTVRIPRTLKEPASEATYPSTFWGPTCDSYDCILRDCYYPELEVGDWLIWFDMGAYTISLARNFNGIFPSKVFPYVMRNEWNSLLNEISANKNMIS